MYKTACMVCFWVVLGVIAYGQPPGSMLFPTASVSVTAEGQIVMHPNPESRTALFSLLPDRQVQAEIGLSEEQADTMNELLGAAADVQKRFFADVRAGKIKPSQAKLKAMIAERRGTLEDAIEELLLPDQLARLRQIAYRIEVARIGLGRALTIGNLSRQVEVHEGQKFSLEEKVSKLESEALRKVEEIMAKLEDDILDQLTPEQRHTAREALGDRFAYKELSNTQKLFEKALETRQKKLEAATK